MDYDFWKLPPTPGYVPVWSAFPIVAFFAMSSPFFPALAPVWLGLIALLALPGCNSFDSRAREKSAAFAALDEATRTRLAAREIRVGDTPDMVYIALGKPSEKTEKTSAEGRSGTWIYTAHWQEYQGTRLVGHRREVVYNPSTKSYQVFYVPDYQPVYAPRSEDRIRVTFENGRVSAVEQAQASATPVGGAVK